MAYHNRSGKTGFVYIISNVTREVLYVGVTSALKERIWAHRIGEGTNFTQKYKIKYLLYYEELPNINEAIEREKQIKNWRREWKFNLIKKINPDFNDLWNQIK